LVARFVRDEEAVGSNPATPTSKNSSFSDLAEDPWGPYLAVAWLRWVMMATESDVVRAVASLDVP
jgi:hypothetical protein